LRIGVLGGSFNPPHNGHLIIASDAFESLGLHKLYVIPAAANPLKEKLANAPTPEQRLEMVRMTFGGDPRFEVSAIEIERGGLSYTVDTLETLSGQHPSAELVLLLGIDSLKTFDEWRSPERIRELATLAALARGEDETEAPRGVNVVTTRRIDVSSTEIRSRLAEGRPIRGFVAESVERYISSAELYKASGPAR
jgi:nicotinate-nucleotide adenylyltransferase